MRDDNVKPDWWCVALDETRYYNIAEEDKPKIEKIVGVYIFNRSEYTHCCEIAPSYSLIHLYDAVYLTEFGEDFGDEMDEKYAHNDSDDCYMHVADVEAIDASKKKQYGEAENEDEVREYWQGNCPF